MDGAPGDPELNFPRLTFVKNRQEGQNSSRAGALELDDTSARTSARVFCIAPKRDDSSFDQPNRGLRVLVAVCAGCIFAGPLSLPVSDRWRLAWVLWNLLEESTKNPSGILYI